jgi:hypothetical protein
MKTIIAVIVFIILAVLIAISFSFFISPKEKIRYQECVLLKNQTTNAIDCFGCANDICKDADLDWQLYQKPEIGIPYACYKTEKGCQLTQ